jgi:rhamnulose-1-phosphate aldolase
MANEGARVELRQVIDSIGEAGQRLSEMGASEGAGGNLSVCLLGPVFLHLEFSQVETIALPLCVPALAGATLTVTGSGTRSRDIARNPGACLAILEVQPGGTQALMRYSPSRTFARVTSEFNSHLAVHHDQVQRLGIDYHAVVHAQPRKLTYLSHISDYQNEDYANRQLFRWQPETVLNFPEGIAIVPFKAPSSDELMSSNVQALRERRAAIWVKHGIMTRSSQSIAAAVDLIDYIEAAAAYECLDLSLGQRAQGLDEAELTSVCARYGVERKLKSFG